ncbi:alpha/beta fold hydrolase [Streptomyces sp. NPDC060322]|uniref:alpha/beta fold hydrolase n=1 Tax=Streptomyces sp. NPDC060322 TaxID=3347097 RepID=UPI0036627E67
MLPESSYRLAAGIPGTRLMELPGAGHLLNPADRATWLRHVREFLASLPATSA